VPVSAYELDLPEVRTSSTGVIPESDVAALGDGWLAKTTLGFAVTHYGDFFELKRDRRFHKAIELVQSTTVEGGATESLKDPSKSLLGLEGEDHTRLRRLVAPSFTPGAANRLRPFMREVLNELVDAVAHKGHCELVGDLCDQYPVAVICELVGAPREDWKLFSRWALDINRRYDNNLAEDLPIIERANAEFFEYIEAMIDERRTRPADDLLSHLIAAEEGGDRLSTAEMLTMVKLVLLGGSDTTRNQLGLCVAVFAEHPDQWALLAERTELATQAAEECLRYLGTIRGITILASEDIEYRDVLFPKGTIISLSVTGANKDAAAWQAPEEFDITKERANRQVIFGSGVHTCLGAPLARAELQEALVVLSQTMPGLELDGPTTWMPSNVAIWGPERLPILFRPSARPAQPKQ
jgi:cytochrome P450